MVDDPQVDAAVYQGGAFPPGAGSDKMESVAVLLPMSLQPGLK
jgi:hypothetical protein